MPPRRAAALAGPSRRRVSAGLGTLIRTSSPATPRPHSALPSSRPELRFPAWRTLAQAAGYRYPWRVTHAVSRPAAFAPAGLGRFAVVFAFAAAAALAAGSLLPVPPPGRAIRFDEAVRPATPFAATPPPSPGTAARPAEVTALRRLVAQLRADYRPLPLAEALERLHALTGEAAPLREAMGLRRDLGDAVAARAALERLALRGGATEAELLQLAEARLEAGDAAAAAAFLLRAFPAQPSEALAYGVLRAAMRLPDPSPPLRMLGARLAELAPQLLEPLRAATLADARPDLALALMEGLPPAFQDDPATVFRMAEAEARVGFPGAALARLLALRALEGLPQGAGALLVDLALREGRLDEAFAVAAQLPPDSWPETLPLRLHEAARAAGRPDLFRAIDPATLASRPAAAAVVALARGDRTLARRQAEAAVARPPQDFAGARGVAAVLREIGQDQAAWTRLRAQIDRAQTDRGAADPASIRLFAELSALPARAALALPLLERLRNEGPLAGEAWMRLALADGRGAAVAAFLRAGGPATPAVLAETLELAAATREPVLAQAAGQALLRGPLPQGWTPEEAAVLADLARPLTPASLAGALDFLGWATEAEARARVATRLAATPEIAGAAAAVPDISAHPAIVRLRAEASVPGEGGIARLALLAVLAPAEAVPLLDRRAAAAPARFGPAAVLARLRAGDIVGGSATLAALLPQLPRAAQEQALFLMLASAPTAARPMLDQAAAATLGAGWRRSYEAALERSGRRAELIAALQARAALPETSASERTEIEARLQVLRGGGG